MGRAGAFFMLIKKREGFCQPRSRNKHQLCLAGDLIFFLGGGDFFVRKAVEREQENIVYLITLVYVSRGGEFLR